MILQQLYDAKLIHPPKWLVSNCAYLTRMGSEAYGCSVEGSDIDAYGFCLPHKEILFPHLAGVIKNFGDQGISFDQWQEHHIKDPNSSKEWDFSVYSIVKYFDLCMGGNPNMTDSLFTPANCVIHSTKISNLVRENRKLFLSKKMWATHKRYSFAQMSRFMGENNNQKVNLTLRFMKEHSIPTSNVKETFEAEQVCRKSSIESITDIKHLSETAFSEYEVLFQKLTDRNISTIENGKDTKAMYHVIRLMNQIEQILVEHDLDLLRNREQLKSIRRGEWSLERIRDYFTEKERSLEVVYAQSTLRNTPNEIAIRALLLQCLEEHYGDISTAVKHDVSVDNA